MSDNQEPKTYLIQPTIAVVEVKNAFPSLHEEAGTFDEGPIKRVGRSAVHPMIYYLFPREGRSHYVINVQKMIESAVDAIERERQESGGGDG